MSSHDELVSGGLVLQFSEEDYGCCMDKSIVIRMSDPPYQRL